MRKILATVAAVAFSAAIAFAASLPNVPSSPQYFEPSQIVPTLNALVQQLNGNVGYGPAQVVSLGAFATNGAGGGTPQNIATSQRGIATFTGVGTLVTGAVTTLVLNNAAVSATSQCVVQVQSGGAAGSAPYISTATPTNGVLTMILANGGTTATGAAATFVLAYICQ